MREEGFWGCRFCFELDLAERRHAAAESQMRYFLEHPTPAKGKKAKLHQATHQYRLKNARVELEITTRRLARYREIVARRDLYELDLYHFEDRVAWYRHSIEAEQDLQELHKNHRVDSSRDEQLEYLMNELRRAETRLTKFNS